MSGRMWRYLGSLMEGADVIPRAQSTLLWVSQEPFKSSDFRDHSRRFQLASVFSVSKTEKADTCDREHLNPAEEATSKQQSGNRWLHDAVGYGNFAFIFFRRYYWNVKWKSRKFAGPGGMIARKFQLSTLKVFQGLQLEKENVAYRNMT